MASRTLLNTAVPEAYQTLLTLNDQVEKAAAEAGIDDLTMELLKIRTSQINGCAFCLRMHTRDALDKGESTDRLAVLPAWRESKYFSAAEQAALAIAEEIALIGNPTAARAAADPDPLTSQQAAILRWAAIVINAFNRIAISSHYVVKP
ncbi:MAG: carboxymuconolactone decarboxylase family protein [Actinobacteria bacterium]|nr:carboxymuconolactone decarboxylase family protein [Actinomycetota bacterium]